MDRHLMYVAMTRHKHDAKLYLDQTDAPKVAQRDLTLNFPRPNFIRERNRPLPERHR